MKLISKITLCIVLGTLSIGHFGFSRPTQEPCQEQFSETRKRFLIKQHLENDLANHQSSSSIRLPINTTDSFSHRLKRNCQNFISSEPFLGLVLGVVYCFGPKIILDLGKKIILFCFES